MIGKGPGRYPRPACSARCASIHASGVADGKWFVNHVRVLASQSSIVLGCASLCAIAMAKAHVSVRARAATGDRHVGSTLSDLRSFRGFCKT